MNEKVKAINPQIVVHGTLEKLYYEISYYDTNDNKWHIGYSSYDLQTVKGYLDSCFEVVDADVEPVKHGHWIDRTIWWGGLGQAKRECSCCGTVFEGRAFSRKSGIGFKYCEECGAKMERENNDR